MGSAKETPLVIMQIHLAYFTQLRNMVCKTTSIWHNLHFHTSSCTELITMQIKPCTSQTASIRPKISKGYFKCNHTETKLAHTILPGMSDTLHWPLSHVFRYTYCYLKNHPNRIICTFLLQNSFKLENWYHPLVTVVIWNKQEIVLFLLKSFS